jgi:hypothetical protein
MEQIMTTAGNVVVNDVADNIMINASLKITQELYNDGEWRHNGHRTTHPPRAL